MEGDLRMEIRRNKEKCGFVANSCDHGLAIIQMLRMVTCAVIELQACPVLYSYGVSYRSRQIATCSLHLRIGLILFFFIFFVFLKNSSFL